MAQRESRRSREIMARLRLKGCFCFKVWGSEHMMVGLPDIIGCCKGKFFGLEVKNPEDRSDTSVRQEYVMDLIRQAGGISQVVCTPEEACKVLGLTTESIMPDASSRRPKAK
jgi:Holliday junction resolvase